ncbi:MAG: ATP-binding domain-containing protein [Sorangiineae bacterium]|nr:ATP-binding domain-containing protein [Polyangiaceae bacterium]MEB2322805.1 ATP-binding domain-containing protein [Sorangiineae bacterium]
MTEPRTELACPPASDDPERDRIVAEEERCLARVLDHLRERAARPRERQSFDYDAELISLRDQIAAARLEDVPPLVEQMERLMQTAARRREVVEGVADARSPYFGHLVLEENGRRREVLIGRSTYLDTKSAVRIVDWRDAPVSRIYYRCEEGEEYEEVFGERELTGTVLTRRSVTIVGGELKRIIAPQGTYVRSASGWRTVSADALRLAGGQGTAARPEPRRPGKLGVGGDVGREDTHLAEITALIDRRQFELITRPDSGLVVIQGGAGSGKTTIGLHRMAYLAFQDRRRFRPDKLLVIVFNEALARYISQVLPALGIDGVAIRTFTDFARKLRVAHFPRLPRHSTDETPGVVTRVKKHAAMLRAVDAYVAALEVEVARELARAPAALREWQKSGGRPFAHRLHGLERWLGEPAGRALPTDERVALERLVAERLAGARDVTAHFFELMTDRAALGRAFALHAPGDFTEGELDRAHAWSAARSADLGALLERRADEREARAERRAEAALERSDDRDRDFDERLDEERRRGHDGGARGPDGTDEPTRGADGEALEASAALDREDDAILLRLTQKLRGALRSGAKNKEPLVYEHVLIDEAQDISPVELAVVLGTVSRGSSLTLAGDVSQRLHMDNGFTSWSGVLGELGLAHVEVEPLRISYRSTQEIIDFSKAVLGPLACQEEGRATRSGAPVELFTFAHSGDAGGFLAEALRELYAAEPRASVAVIARYPEQADAYFDALAKAEVPYARRIADQDFPFKPGIDVTDVRQVKGLEFDYVVLVEAGAPTYPATDEARHLLHIAATRAAHQLWVMVTGAPSSLLPAELLARGY